MDISKEIRGTVTMISEDRVAVEITLFNEVSLGVLYYERPKLGWVNKPIMPTKWRCVDAKVEGVYQYKGESITPQQLMDFAQKLVEENMKKGGENNGKEDNPND